ncbi:hypothetical protein KCTC32516_01212 [Polaribacter huanghezhanensis]|uniref:Rdx family protein n=1 Tax=Polaribacter huanghezhanensis TaxID=1354726 RepID=UPI002646FD7B|nr:Rdx family protein [Polaribacter huanghezhanensis]WKD85865.1 hypothetical protein KCTC32516_01212 [Polaribacter huanghezhanensis]
MDTTSNKFNISIEYCVPCDYSDYAIKETTSLIKNFQHNINQLALITGSKGVFDIKVDDEIIFSKTVLNRYPNTGELVDLIKEKKGL